MKAIILIASAICALAAPRDEIEFPEFSIGTNSTKKTTISRRNNTEAIIRYEGGITKARILDLKNLPEDWYRDARAEEARLSAEAKRAEERRIEQQKLLEEREKERRRQLQAARAKTVYVPEPEPPPTMASKAGESAAAIAFGIFFLAVYFIPSGVALGNKSRNVGAIFILNIFLGWTLIGWVAALVWAMYVERPVIVVQNPQAHPPAPEP
jgi:uncharacterized membrane protein YqaE (UPF0057 family)